MSFSFPRFNGDQESVDINAAQRMLRHERARNLVERSGVRIDGGASLLRLIDSFVSTTPVEVIDATLHGAFRELVDSLCELRSDGEQTRARTYRLLEFEKELTGAVIGRKGTSTMMEIVDPDLRFLVNVGLAISGLVEKRAVVEKLRSGDLSLTHYLIDSGYDEFAALIASEFGENIEPIYGAFSVSISPRSGGGLEARALSLDTGAHLAGTVVNFISPSLPLSQIEFVVQRLATHQLFDVLPEYSRASHPLEVWQELVANYCASFDEESARSAMGQILAITPRQVFNAFHREFLAGIRGMEKIRFNPPGDIRLWRTVGISPSTESIRDFNDHKLYVYLSEYPEAGAAIERMLYSLDRWSREIRGMSRESVPLSERERVVVYDETVSGHLAHLGSRVEHSYGALAEQLHTLFYIARAARPERSRQVEAALFLGLGSGLGHIKRHLLFPEDRLSDRDDRTLFSDVSAFRDLKITRAWLLSLEHSRIAVRAIRYFGESGNEYISKYLRNELVDPHPAGAPEDLSLGELREFVSNMTLLAVRAGLTREEVHALRSQLWRNKLDEKLAPAIERRFGRLEVERSTRTRPHHRYVLLEDISEFELCLIDDEREFLREFLREHLVEQPDLFIDEWGEIHGERCTASVLKETPLWEVLKRFSMSEEVSKRLGGG